jgi:hypothetical protein
VVWWSCKRSLLPGPLSMLVDKLDEEAFPVGPTKRCSVWMVVFSYRPFSSRLIAARSRPHRAATARPCAWRPRSPQATRARNTLRRQPTRLTTDARFESGLG